MSPRLETKPREEPTEMRAALACMVAFALALGCGSPASEDAGVDASVNDAGPRLDAGLDAGADGGALPDAGPIDAGPAPDACVSTDETCDGADEDCDGEVDEDFDLTSDDAHCGQCSMACTGGEVCFASACGPDVVRPVQITAGRAHTCVRMSDNSVRCWGDNARGQLGQGDADPHAGIVTVLDLTRARDVDAGDDHTCAVSGSGTAVCWGDDSAEQIGDGAGPAIGYASRPHGVRGGIVGIDRVSAGGHTSGASSPFGSAFAWGAGESGQIGDGSTMMRDSATSVMRDALLFERISVGASHACALARDGTAPGHAVHCWGDNASSGAHGDGSFEPHLTPAASLFPPATDIEAGAGVTCAITVEGGVRCAGSNRYGTLGDGEASHGGAGAFDRSATPVDTGLAEVAALSMAGDHGCVALADGTARCWGRGDRGQLGDGLDTHASCSGADATECALSPVVVDGLGDVADVATGAAHTCVITALARVFCWGANDAGQLGVAGPADRRSPVEVVLE